MFTRCLLVGIAWFATAAAADPSGQRFDDLVRAEATRQHLPGVALVVAKDGHIIYQFATGEANRKTRQPMTVDTAFEIASISKQFLASALLLLAADHKLPR